MYLPAWNLAAGSRNFNESCEKAVPNHVNEINI